jgi:DNA-3-methyladenine glycosylase I
VHTVVRCPWAGNDPDYRVYHDQEWGVPIHNDTKLFEMLILESFQAGLSWITILRKRPAFTKAFCNWDIQCVAQFTEADLERLMQDAGIVRNRRKIAAAITNAQIILEIIREYGSLDQYIWQFTEGKTLHPSKPYKTLQDVPCTTAVSDTMSATLKKRGFLFVGTTICYSFMQAVGMADDHIAECFRHKKAR